MSGWTAFASWVAPEYPTLVALISGLRNCQGDCYFTTHGTTDHGPWTPRGKGSAELIDNQLGRALFTVAAAAHLSSVVSNLLSVVSFTSYGFVNIRKTINFVDVGGRNSTSVVTSTDK